MQEFGHYYRLMMTSIDETVSNLKTYAPNYKGQGYEIVGFVWFQGYNDKFSDHSTSSYQENMANFIRDVRKDLKSPKLPFVIGAMGHNGKQQKGSSKILAEAQIATAQMPEFKGNVITDNKDNVLYSYFFRPGISRVGSNLITAANILDDDPATFWEPNPLDPLDDWWIEVDLGRVVAVDSLILHFVADELGDPFFQFRVLAAPDQEPVQENFDKITFERVASTQAPNRDQRTFRFGLEQFRSDPNWAGKMVETIRIVVSDTRGGRSELIAEGEWLALPANERGDIVYFIRDQQGFEEPVAQEIYDSLEAERQGRKDHYRRERPRLAEVEVIALGDNIVTLTQRVLFEDQVFYSNFLRRQLTDGLHSTFFDLKVYDPFGNTNQVDMDLGAKYWINKVRLVSPRDPPVAYQMRVSDGSINPAGGLVWTNFDERLNPDSFLQLEEAFPLREIRHIEVRRLDLVGSSAERATLSEVQAYGEGYVSEVKLTSPLIKLGQTRIFSTVEWQSLAPPGTSLEVRTRSGDDLLIVTRHYDTFGREITEERWTNLRNEAHRGPVVVEEYPGPRWSRWSEVYAESGEAFKSPSPRQMVQVQLLH